MLLVGTSVHTAHVHLGGTYTQEQLPANRIVSVELVESRGLGIERDIGSHTERDLVRLPNVAEPAEGVGADPGMMGDDP